LPLAHPAWLDPIIKPGERQRIFHWRRRSGIVPVTFVVTVPFEISR
jgi:hypothetical protein